MKKLLLIAALLFASYGAFADEFDDIVNLFKVGAAQQGWKVRGDKPKRIIFIDIKLPMDGELVTQEVFDLIKPMVIENFRKELGPDGIAMIRSYRLTLCLNFITNDGKILKLVLSPTEL